ncbi:MAG: type III pantothenate kinase [Bilifractor sp.]
MILAIDIGNTHMVLGCIQEEKNLVIRHIQMSTNKIETYHEYAAEISRILSLEQIDPHDFNGCLISSVVPSVTHVVAEAVKLLTGRDALILGEGIDVPLELDMNGIPASAIAGDLLATAVAAKAEYPLPAFIIDMGTATTITALSSKGVYIGGCILPGPGTALKGLIADTSLLPAVDFVAPDQAIAKDTVNAIRSGIVYGSAGQIDGLLDRFTQELSQREETESHPTMIATGGMGHLIAPFCRHKIIVDDELLLKGLGIIWKQNHL